MKIGYARVSTKDQNLNLQIEALTREGCELIYYEKQSSSKERLEFEKLRMLSLSDSGSFFPSQLFTIANPKINPQS